jgi:ribosome-binding factor A
MTRQRKNAAPTQRMLRVGELVRHALAELLMRGEIDDEILLDATITVPEVRMTPDLKLAKAYVMPLGGVHADEIVAALNRHAKFVRGAIGHRIDLKYAPEIRFYIDATFEEADRIENLLRSERVQKDLHYDEDEDGDD